jgi:methylated-DNA-[protein]-cysteine S-methyltransferase
MSPLPSALLESVAAAAVQEGLADAVFTRLASPLGRLLVVQGPQGLVRISFAEEPEDATLAGVAAALGPRIVGSDRELAVARDTLSAYLEGQSGTLDLPVDLRLMAPPFRRRVLETLHREVGRGETVTYGALARRAGNPKAARAVGTTMNRNRIPIVLPCHRVVGSNGSLVGYAGGLDTKRYLLELEGSLGTLF